MEARDAIHALRAWARATGAERVPERIPPLLWTALAALPEGRHGILARVIEAAREGREFGQW